MAGKVTLILMTTLLSLTAAQEVADGDDKDSTMALNYLTQFKYLKENNLVTKDAYTHAIKKLQKNLGLPITGELNAETKDMLVKPRCGMPDDANNSRRRKRYMLEGDKWPGNQPNLTYYFNKKSKSANVASFYRDEMRAAFKMWSDVANINFREIDENENRRRQADHIIDFATGYHDDSDPFDGPSGVVAHANLPNINHPRGGDIHFDDDETWTTKTSKGINFLETAVHEIGHAIGIGHSKIRSAIMYPYIISFKPNLQLDQDDKNAVIENYGRRLSPAPPPPPSPPPSPRPPSPPSTTQPPKTPNKEGTKDYLCSLTNNEVDAMVTTQTRDTYILKGKFAYRIGRIQIEEAFELPAELRNPDTALSVKAQWIYRPCNNREACWKFIPASIYIFKDSNVYKMKASEFKAGMSTFGTKISINEAFPNLGDGKLTAAFVWSGNNKIYFFRGDDYYRTSTSGAIDSGYPRSKSIWNMNIAVREIFQYSNGRTYFFDDKDNYYRYDDQRLQVDRSYQPYPRSIKTWWFGCQYNEQSLVSDDMASPFREANMGIIVEPVNGSPSFTSRKALFSNLCATLVALALIRWMF